MADPFLVAHEVEPLLFDVGGPRAPVSIRDQILRARYLIERLLRAGLVGTNSRVLIVGAGVGGVATALDAAANGLRPTLIDAGNTFFQLQAACTSRWIDPVQYDWPQNHWNQGIWPAFGPTAQFPMGFAAERASTIAKIWSSSWSLAQAFYGSSLTVWLGTELLAWPTPVIQNGQAQALDVRLQQGTAQRSDTFDIVILARGFGTERSWVEDNANFGPTAVRFDGLQFWSSDQFESPSLGLPTPATGIQPTVLVTGGGDGAMQDFLRLVTGLKSARDLAEYLVQMVPDWGPLFVAAGMYVFPEEDQAQRALLWSEPELDHPILERLHSWHSLVIDEIARGPTWAEICLALDSLTAGRPVSGIRMAFPCSHFAPSYPLNRFMTLLLVRWLQKSGSSSPLLQESRAVRITPATAHACTTGCWGPRHEVTLVASQCQQPIGATLSPPMVVDGVVVRNGIEPHPLRALQPRRVVRQTPPYHAP